MTVFAINAYDRVQKASLNGVDEVLLADHPLVWKPDVHQ